MTKKNSFFLIFYLFAMSVALAQEITLEFTNDGNKPFEHISMPTKSLLKCHTIANFIQDFGNDPNAVIPLPFSKKAFLLLKPLLLAEDIKSTISSYSIDEIIDVIKLSHFLDCQDVYEISLDSIRPYLSQQFLNKTSLQQFVQDENFFQQAKIFELLNEDIQKDIVSRLSDEIKEKHPEVFRLLVKCISIPEGESGVLNTRIWNFEDIPADFNTEAYFQREQFAFGVMNKDVSKRDKILFLLHQDLPQKEIKGKTHEAVCSFNLVVASKEHNEIYSLSKNAMAPRTGYKNAKFSELSGSLAYTVGGNTAIISTIPFIPLFLIGNHLAVFFNCDNVLEIWDIRARPYKLDQRKMKNFTKLAFSKLEKLLKYYDEMSLEQLLFFAALDHKLISKGIINRHPHLKRIKALMDLNPTMKEILDCLF